jgi:uncharacterized protein (TIGR03382 family)
MRAGITLAGPVRRGYTAGISPGSRIREAVAVRTRGLFPVVLLSALATGACEVGESPATAFAGQSIIGGSPASEGQFPTVVAVVIDQGRRGMCTGTLVGPDLVLTAAHCIDPAILRMASQDQVTSTTQIVFDGTDLQSGQFGDVVGARETIPYPGFNQPGDPDVGLVRLTRPITDRAPSPVNLDPAGAPIGLSVTMVGYGVTEQGGGGRNMFLENKTSSSCAPAGVSDATFLCFSQTDGRGKCSGDSGGPSFATINDNPHTVVGITSFGDQNCQLFGADMRTDASKDFFRQNAPELLCGDDGYCEASCGADGLPVDPNCSDCTVDDDCAGGEFCDAGFCTPEPFEPGGLGSECESDADCASGVCASGPDGNLCSSACELEASDCPGGFDCLSAGDGGACWPADGGGGCNAVGDSSPATGFTALLLLALAAVLRRRRSH